MARRRNAMLGFVGHTTDYGKAETEDARMTRISDVARIRIDGPNEGDDLKMRAWLVH